MHLLTNTIQPYAWGSRVALAELRGQSGPSSEPEAELWMGAHPSASSRIGQNGEAQSLLDLIARDPKQTLGEDVADRFGPRLPFLLKVLAAETPLSLQAHPSLEQARAGYAAEEAGRIPLQAPNRNYKDPNHKPELICALGTFHALVGFREIGATLELFDRLAIDRLEPLLAPLRAEPSPQGLRRFFESILTAAGTHQGELSKATLVACRQRQSEGAFSEEYAWGTRIGALYPGDAGIVIALCLNLVRLDPGEALYLPAGNLHAYLQGTGVEIMASSDNVLRGGLTPKHVDVPELLKVLDFNSGPVTKVLAQASGVEFVYQTPAPDFRLSRIEISGRISAPRSSGPEIVLTARGAVRLVAKDNIFTLPQGASAFVPASDGEYEFEGDATVFRAGVGAKAT